MEKQDTVIASKIIEISEHPSYLELTDRVFYYDAPNANGVQIDFESSSLEKAQSLVDMPVVAQFICDNSGKPTLGGHAAKYVPGGGIKFGTSAIGVHTNVWIDDAEITTFGGEKKTAKCLFSTMRIWSRFENMVAAVKRLYEENRLYNSWEISVGSYEYSEGIKKLVNYEFIGNALLGEAQPAYGSASQVLALAEEDESPQLLIAEALSADLIGGDSASDINQLDDSKSDRKEMTPKMEANENIVVGSSEVETEEEAVETVEETVEETAEVNTEEIENNEEAEVSEEDPVSDDAQAENAEVEASEDADTENTEAKEPEEVSAKQTSEDIYRMIYDAVEKLRDDKGEWYYVAMLFPEDKLVLVQNPRMPKLEFVQYSYEIIEDEAVFSNKQDVEMIISPLNINSEIESKNNALAGANSRIEELSKCKEELSKCKEELDKIKAEQAEANRAEAVNKLREYVVKSGRFTEEEIASEEIQKAINDLNEAWIKAEIADRLVASMAGNKDKMAETAEVKNKDNSVSILLSESANKDADVTPDDVMNKFFNRD